MRGVNMSLEKYNLILSLLHITQLNFAVCVECMELLKLITDISAFNKLNKVHLIRVDNFV